MQPFPWDRLLDWYKENGRHDLPWRNYTHPQDILLYRVWISEIFLQQTQVSRVIGYFERVMQEFPNIQALGTTDYDTFFPYYQGLGYYSRARNILKTAKIISQEYGGIFPKEQEKLKKLPGVGPYTSNAILAFGYGESYLAWDTNLEKVFSRYYKGTKDIKLTPEEKEIIEKEFQSFCVHHCEEGVFSSGESHSDSVDPSFGTKGRIQGVPPLDPSFHSGGRNKDDAIKKNDIVRAINNALMDFAATVDLKDPVNIEWDNYPIKSGIFFETRGTLEPKAEKKSTTFPTPDATVIVTLHKDHKVYFSSTTSVISSQSEKSALGKNSGADVSLRSTGQNGIQNEHSSGYSPFLLPPALHRDTRKYVQGYFRMNYNLELSVRPVHKKWFDNNGKPYIEVNAQIQVGVPQFEMYTKTQGNFAKMSRKE